MLNSRRFALREVLFLGCTSIFEYGLYFRIHCRKLQKRTNASIDKETEKWNFQFD